MATSTIVSRKQAVELFLTSWIEVDPSNAPDFGNIIEDPDFFAVMRDLRKLRNMSGTAKWIEVCNAAITRVAEAADVFFEYHGVENNDDPKDWEFDVQQRFARAVKHSVWMAYRELTVYGR